MQNIKKEAQLLNGAFRSVPELHGNKKKCDEKILPKVVFV